MLEVKPFMVRQDHHERLNLMAVTRERGNDTNPGERGKNPDYAASGSIRATALTFA